MFSEFWSRLSTHIFRKMTKLTKPPIVVVMGATGTGKSKLSIEIAQRFNGEVVNADSLQVYKGLDVVTNKVTPEELEMVPHHLIDFLDPLTPMTVVDYRNRGLPIIEGLLNQNKMPVIVGGTQYYIESLLYDYLVDADKVKKDKYLFDLDKEIREHHLPEKELTASNIFSNPILMSSFREVSSSHLHSILSHLDPEAASVLHPGEKRKIIRALQVMQRNDGTKYSAILEEQRSREGGSNHSGPLRFKNAIIFWAHTQEEILNKRLDDRVDVMLNNGLVQELLEFHEKYRKSRIERGFKTDYSEGIFQAIGLRDFHQYLILPESQRGLSNKRILEDCVYEMKIQTRKYAKRQVKNFRSRLLEAHGRQVPPIFLLDTSHPEQWNEAVRDKAFRILDFIMTQQNLPNDLQPLKWESKPIDRRTIKRCDICDKVVSGEEQWAAHIQSKGHKALYKIKKQSKESGSVSSVSKEVYSKEEMVKNLES